MPSTELDRKQIDAALAGVETEISRLCALRAGAVVRATVDRFLVDSGAALFHLRSADSAAPAMVVILGGTGTGKSTLVNRLLGADVSAASFRRTFTAGPVAVTRKGSRVPDEWLRLPARSIDEADLPARGELDRLTIVSISTDSAILRGASIIDTPDLDGDQPAHHALADRAFRWAHGIVFLVTPEKYQMTELPPYYRLARRYGVPCLFVMNKADEEAVVADYATQLRQSYGVSDARVFCVPRDDAAFEPDREIGLDALRSEIAGFATSNENSSDEGLSARVVDVCSRARDQVLHPLLDARREVDRIIAALRELTTTQPELNLAPVTMQLQRRLQQRSVLYLMGPGRLLDRARQLPMMLARLPRNTWDLFRRGQIRTGNSAENDLPGDDWAKSGPDFRGALVDAFTVLHSRIDDIVRSTPLGEKWIGSAGAANNGDSPTNSYAAARIDAAEAGRIAESELEELREWLTKHWNVVPRDTRVVQALLRVIPGGKKLASLSEAAPYLLAVVVATHHAFFGHVDLLILGGFSLATWLSEKLSNEVSGRTKRANARIGTRFTDLADKQIKRVIEWLERQAPARQDIERVLVRVESVQEMVS